LWNWRGIISDNFGYSPFYLVAEEDGKLEGVLPLFLVRSLLFGKSFISIPIAVYGGPISNNERAEAALLKTAEMLASNEKANYLEIRGNPYRSNKSLTRENGRLPYIEKNLYFTFLIEIDRDLDVNMSRIPRKQRRMIRQGQKNGLQAIVDNARLRDCYDVYAESVRNLGTPVFPYRYFETLTQRFGDDCRVLLVRYNNQTVAAVLVFVYKDQILPYYAGARREYFHLAANDFMYWELLSYAARNGYQTFDFGRSKKGTGSFDFKRHWGFEPRPLPYWYQSINGQAVPDTSSMNPKLQWAVRTWRKLPLSLSKKIGPRLSKHIVP
jgi:FemAB-related protein (PEP-CTERM system-associated)